MTELVARHTEGARVTMRGMFESATWPLRKLVWKLEEKLVWRLADLFRKRPAYRPAENEYIPAQTDLTLPEPAVKAPSPAVAAAAATAPPAAAGQTRGKLPSLPRLRTPGRDLSVALATVAIAVGGGIAIATIVGGSDDAASPMPPASGNAAAPQSQPSADGQVSAQPQTLQGAAPDFEATGQPGQATAADAAAPANRAQASPTAATNSKPSAIPPSVGGTASATNTARDFAGAFVLYEVGKSNAEVRRTFTQTATPTLAEALRDRPPRLPESVQVPTAKVQNVVLGAQTGRTAEASVALLRLGDLSELRLTLTRRAGEWRVSEVRG